MVKVAIETLGCSKNMVDSENILGYLKSKGLIPVDNFEEADIIVVNTCGFITPAKEESINTILELAAYKERNNLVKLVVTGCMTAKYGSELLKEIPEIDAAVDINNLDSILSLAGKNFIHGSNLGYKRITQTGCFVRYLKIAEGCDNFCTYCTIPELKGKYESFSRENIINEARELIADGAKELNLIAQDITRYGIDTTGKHELAELVKSISSLNGDFWVRLLYCYPTDITSELIDVVAAYPKVCKYLDIPLQHVSTSVLNRMGRRGSKEEIIELIHKLRSRIPQLSIRSTFIVGFPGETKEDFEELLCFLREVKLDWVGAFTYWQETDTPAAKLPNQIPKRIKEERYHKLMEVQREITTSKNFSLVGTRLTVLIEDIFDDDEQYRIGRSQYQAPEVDGLIIVKTAKEVGNFVETKITDVNNDFDLLGEDINESC